MRMLAAMLSVGLLGGCARAILDRNVGKIDGPPAFQDGYRDGCASGLRAGGFGQIDFKKDVARYNAEPLYLQGWDNGYNVCRSRAIN